VTALLAAVILAGVGIGLIAGGQQIAGSQQVAERTASALVLSVADCDRTSCSYQVSYLAEGATRTVTIGGDIGAANADSTTTIYYQVAHPDVARFPHSDYPGDTGDPLTGLGVILLLCGLVLAVIGVVRLIRGRLRARRASA
jgi:MFS superfamily sulfate permease-like transporter